MALRILFLLIGIILVVNIVLSAVGLILGVNLYKKYGKEILIFFTSIVLFMIAVYLVFSLMGLIE